MPREFSRTHRVSELIQRELANIISTRLNDPRMSMVTITAVDVSKDLKNAKVFFTHMSDEDRASASKTLDKASGYLRRELSHRLKMKSSPSLSFVYDNSVEHGAALSKLIDTVNKDTRGS